MPQGARRSELRAADIALGLAIAQPGGGYRLDGRGGGCGLGRRLAEDCAGCGRDAAS
jgi:hypothetical protein